jgi:hypothetical protein
MEKNGSMTLTLNLGSYFADNGPRVRMVGAQDAAKILGVTPTALYQWRKQKIGPPFRALTDTCIRYQVGDLEDFLAAKIIETDAEAIRHVA